MVSRQSDTLSGPSLDQAREGSLNELPFAGCYAYRAAKGQTAPRQLIPFQVALEAVPHYLPGVSTSSLVPVVEEGTEGYWHHFHHRT